MSDPHPFTDTRVRLDFSRARLMASLRATLATLRGETNQLLTFDEVREKLRVGGPIYRGIQQVPLSKIVGSVDRYHDFDRAFLPLNDRLADRWRSINRAFYQDVSLPPVLLYKVDDAYFVVDGHHRVSVAREHGQTYIDADVRQCSVSVPVGANVTADDLISLGQQVEFYERTHINQLRPNNNILVTVLGGYDRMLEHIAVHRYFMGLDFNRDISTEEAVSHWYDQVYATIVTVLDRNHVSQAFPRRTLSDVYLWVLDHQHFLAAEHGPEHLATPEQAAETFVELVQGDATTDTLPLEDTD